MLLSENPIGAIAGVTTVLNDYWNAAIQAKSPVTFPMPSMVGSGDRMAVCWAVTGQDAEFGGASRPAETRHALSRLPGAGLGL